MYWVIKSTLAACLNVIGSLMHQLNVCWEHVWCSWFNTSASFWWIGVSVPSRAFWRHVGESFLRFGVWDWNDVFVEGSHDLLNFCLVSELSGVVVVGIREDGEADLGRGAERRVDDWKRRGESRFGARHCWVVALQEGFIYLAVFLSETVILCFNQQLEDWKKKKNFNKWLLFNKSIAFNPQTIKQQNKTDQNCF